jgi:hypothetical protein
MGEVDPLWVVGLREQVTDNPVFLELRAVEQVTEIPFIENSIILWPRCILGRRAVTKVGSALRCLYLS